MIAGSGVDENGLTGDGQHAVPSRHQVDKFQILPCEFEDSNQIIDVELFTDRSSPISHVDDVTLNRSSDPNSIGGYREVIDELHISLKTLQLTLTENKRLLACVQAELDEEYRKRRHWETKFHRVNRDIGVSRGLGAGNQTEFNRDKCQRSSSRGSTTRNVDNGDSRRSDWQFTDQRNDSSRPERNMNQQGLHRVQYRQESQGRDGGEGHPGTYTRGVLPKRGMESLFFQGGRGAPRGRNNTFRGQLRKRGCFKCDNFFN